MPDTSDYTHISVPRYPINDMRSRAQAYYQALSTRRSIRDFQDKDIPLDIIEQCIKTASEAPNGANLQPWHFVVVKDKALKHRIRLAAEEEERSFYSERASEEWLEDLATLGTDADKSFIDEASALIVVFAQRYGLKEDGSKKKHYYVNESVGIAIGFLISALHYAGIGCLTHTPSPMNFLGEILGRPKNETAYLNLVIGYPAEDVRVPRHALEKKPLSDILTVH